VRARAQDAAAVPTRRSACALRPPGKDVLLECIQFAAAVAGAAFCAPTQVTLSTVCRVGGFPREPACAFIQYGPRRWCVAGSARSAQRRRQSATQRAEPRLTAWILPTRRHALYENNSCQQFRREETDSTMSSETGLSLSRRTVVRLGHTSTDNGPPLRRRRSLCARRIGF